MEIKIDEDTYQSVDYLSAPDNTYAVFPGSGKKFMMRVVFFRAETTAAKYPGSDNPDDYHIHDFLYPICMPEHGGYLQGDEECIFIGTEIEAKKFMEEEKKE